MSKVTDSKTRKDYRKPEAKPYQAQKKASVSKPLSGSRSGQKTATAAKPHSGQKTAGTARIQNGKKSLCPYAETCGGCQFIDTPYADQLKIKKAYVEEQLKKAYAKSVPIYGMEQPAHYRNKVHAAFDRDRRGNILAGTYESSTHHVVDIRSCYLDDPKADAIILTIKKLLPSFKIKTYDEVTGYGLFRHALIRVGKTSGEVMVVLVLASPILPSKNNFVKALRKEHPEITTVILNVNDQHTSMVLGSRCVTLYGKGYIQDTLCGKTFHISPTAFYQVNPVQTEKLYRKAIEFAGLTGRETVLDTYCGIGTIGIIASEKAKQVIGVELNREAVRDAIQNAKVNDAGNIRFYAQDAGDFMTELSQDAAYRNGTEKIDVIFMDPPRAGSSEDFLASAVMLDPKKIVYISCNPETLSRDLEFLTESGYEVKNAAAYDLFPFTSHVETVVLLSRDSK